MGRTNGPQGHMSGPDIELRPIGTAHGRSLQTDSRIRPASMLGVAILIPIERPVTVTETGRYTGQPERIAFCCERS